MNRVLQVITVLIFVGVMYAIHQGSGVFLRWGGPDFTSGFLVGGVFTVIVMMFAHWLDGGFSSSRQGKRPGEQQGPEDPFV